MKRCLWIALAWAIAVRLVASEPPPNVLLIVTDDQGVWDARCYGNPVLDTPAIDRLAREGVMFTRCHAEMVCAPTRAGLLTGRCYLRTGVYNTRFGGDTMARDERTCAEVLQQAGYETALIGKWHLGRYPGYQPHQRGFAEFFGFYQGHLERYDYPDPLVHNGRPVEARGYITDLLTDAALAFMRRHQAGPFFCMVAYNAPHSPFVAGASHDGQPAADAVIEKYLARGVPLRDARIYAMIEILDRNVARLLDWLDRSGLARRTIVIFTSDNGGVSRFFNGGLRGRKASPYEGGVRVPFIARWPGRFPAGARVDSLVTLMDVMPTLCELVNVPLPQDRPYDGKNIAALLRNGGGPSPHQFVCHTWDRYQPNPDGRWCIVEGRYKLVGIDTSRNRPALYDLQNDPGEKRDIAAEHPDVAKRLHERFRNWFADVTRGRTYRPVPIPLGYDAAPVEIQASWAECRGQNVRYVFRGYDWDTIEGWREPGESASWRLEVVRAGTYRVYVSYGCQEAERPAVVQFSVGDAQLHLSPQRTITPDVMRRDRLGTVHLEPGPATLRAEIVRAGSGEAMRLNRLWFVPVVERSGRPQ